MPTLISEAAPLPSTYKPRVARGWYLLVAALCALSAGSAAALPVGQHATWKYEATGTDLGTSWSLPGYEDSGWPNGAGPLGYGETYIWTTIPYGPDPNNRYPTTYFRLSFDVGVDPSQVVGMILDVEYDDGFIAYLNGHEVTRRAMPAGAATYGTWALEHEAAGYESIDLTSSIGWLVPGTNVFAVEVHQATAASSDLVWDASLTCDTGGAKVIRGPYLQSVTQTSAIVRWRTDVSTDSEVRYALDGQPLYGVIRNATQTTEHEIDIPWLAADTRYDYTIGSRGIVLSGGAEDYFQTAPAEATGPVRLWAIGDSGTGTFEAAAVRNAYLNWTGERGTDLWIALGDNAYYSGFDSEYQVGVFEMYGGLMSHMALWPARGNHDMLHPPPDFDYYSIFSLPADSEAGGVPSGTEAYYAVDYRNVHLICLDSEGSDRSPGSPMLTWLAADLAATDKEWVIVYFHHPPYTKGSHDSDDPNDSQGKMFDMRENVVPVLEASGVDLVLSGHSHDYERSYLLDGHYGTSNTLDPSMILDGGDGRIAGDGAYRKPPGRAPHAGAVYVVAGSAGHFSGGSEDHPVMYRSLLEIGSFVADVDGPRLKGRFINGDGVVRDSFTIAKDLPLAAPVAAAPSIRTLTAYPNPFTVSTRLGFTLPAAAGARLSLLDIGGRRVRTLADGAWAAGRHVVTWDGRDEAGAALPAGVYFAVLEAGGRRETQRIVRME